ncbi:protein SPMIP2 isoform X2 [Mobula hypostoma]|uniref:protein SPMIP2 isoform X2 n=1 Tax=Mobula hypostoma TaxID=723540 RepID=UPI002FC2E98A
MSLLAGGSNPVRSWRYAETGTESVVFTGPDASRDYRSKLPDFPHYIGENRHISAESTGDLNYLYRSARYDSYQKRKDCYVGEIGWGLCFGPKLNRSNLLSGMQIKLGEFRERAEDKVTHRYQNPWIVSHYHPVKRELPFHSSPMNTSLKALSSDCYGFPFEFLISLYSTLITENLTEYKMQHAQYLNQVQTSKSSAVS